MYFYLPFRKSCLQKSQVWEITGAEFSQAEVHTADGISIRFPRCTKIRSDKTWEEATDLPRLKVCGCIARHCVACNSSSVIHLI